ncbi:MAG: fibronectin type III domain-containing protein [Patescibacteria group bacterium]
MKKKTAPKAEIKKTASKSKARRTSRTLFPVITIHRFIIVSAVIIALGALFIIPQKRDLQQAVAGLSIAKPLYSQAIVGWDVEPKATAYNVYYKEVGDDAFSNAVQVPAPSNTHTIQFLKKNGNYLYRVAAVDAKGSEYRWSDVKEIDNLQGM